MNLSADTEISELEKAITVQEGLRATVEDAVVEATLRALRKQLAEQVTANVHRTQQRKQVTVMFADLLSYTSMSEAMDAEDVAEIINAVWKRLDCIITDWGGLIDKHMGDAVMALWGAELVREDDPVRSIRAALAMQSEIRSFGNVANGHRLQMRIGINTGQVLLGEVGSRHEFTALGNTVNLASRLEHVAPADGVLISHDTYLHVRGIFELRALPPMELKGQREAVRTYLVLGVKPHAFRVGTRGLEGVETRMIGRTPELRNLVAEFAALWEHQRLRMVTVTGEAGVGKSRLLHEFGVVLDLFPKRFHQFKGRSSEGMRAVPFGLLRDVFCGRFQIHESDSQAQVWEKVENEVFAILGRGEDSLMRAHFIGHLLGFDFRASPHLSGIIDNARQIRHRALVYLSDYLKRLGANRPVLILLEDLHWADESSLQTFDHLAGELDEVPILIVSTARPSHFEDHPKWGGNRQSHNRLNLSPLSVTDSHRLVRELLQGADDIPPALYEKVVNNAGGNPFYVEEFIKMLIEDGVIARNGESWRVDSSRLGGVRVPSTLTAVLQARLDSLPSSEKAALQQASVLGRVFWEGAVAFLAQPDPLEPNSTREALDKLLGRELVHERETSAFANVREFCFKHPLLQDTAYDSVLKRLRREYHAKAADWLISRCGARAGEMAGLIAHHLEKGGATERAVDYLKQAGLRALATCAYREALGFFQRALALAPMQSHVWIALSIHSSDAIKALGELTKARKQLEDGMALARQWGDEAGIALALERLGMIALDRGDWEAARTRLGESMTIAESISDKLLLARILYGTGIADLRQGALSEARECFARSLEWFRTLDLCAGQARSLNGLATVAFLSGNYREAQTLYEKSLFLSRSVGDRFDEATALTNLGELARKQEDYLAAQAYYGESLRILRELGAPVHAELNNLAHTAVALGQFEEAVDTYHQAMKLALDSGALPDVLESLAGLAGALAKTGAPLRALELLGFVLHHPALWDETRQQSVSPLLASLRETLPSEEFETGLARGQVQTLEGIMESLLQQDGVAGGAIL